MPANPSPPPPDARSLHEAALRHLARYAATQAGLLRVLVRRVERWGRAVEAPAEAVAAAREAADAVVQGLAAAGAVDDAAFAANRARSLARAGRSRRAITAHLAACGVPAALTAAVPDDPAAELAAALAYVRRRRMGPFRTAQATPELRHKELARLARAGFPQAIATRTLALDPAAAEALLLAAKRDLG